MEPTEALVDAVIAGDSQAWRRLAEGLASHIQALARSNKQLRARGLAAKDDDIAEVVTATLERFARHDYKNLKKYAEQRDRAGSTPQSFDSWLFGAVEYAIRDHLRKRYGRSSRGLSPDAPRQSKRDINSHAGPLEEERFDATYLRQLGITIRLTVSEIFEYIDSAFSIAEADAMRRYYQQDQSFEEIAHALALEHATEAEKLIRRLNARLRYKFEG